MKEKSKEKEKKKKVDIFSLYQKEKLLTFTDDENRTSSILLIKLTQGQRQKLLEGYIDTLANIREKYTKRDKESGYYTKALELFNTEQLTEAIMNYEEGQRSQILDLYPIENEETLSPVKREASENKIISDWKKTRHEQLTKLTKEELLKHLGGLTLEGLALVEAGKVFDYLCLKYMCYKPDTREATFKSVEDVERITDRRVLDKLIEELQEFRKMENMQEVRETVQNENFLVSGESPKNSEGSPNTIITKS